VGVALTLGPERPLIFRITHIDNVRWILRHGLHCRNSDLCDPDYKQIGDPDVIGRRHGRTVPIPPGGTLSDYVPFYFTPWTPMLYNIVTGFRGVPLQPRPAIVMLVASLSTLARRGVPFVFTDGHALPVTAYYSSDLDDLARIDWDLLNSRDFRRDPEDPGKFERYQAEALVHRHLPLDTLAGIGCYDEEARGRIEALAREEGVGVTVRVRPEWYV